MVTNYKDKDACPRLPPRPQDLDTTLLTTSYDELFSSCCFAMFIKYCSNKTCIIFQLRAINLSRYMRRGFVAAGFTGPIYQIVIVSWLLTNTVAVCFDVDCRYLQ